MNTFIEERPRLLRHAENWGAPEPEEAVQDAYAAAWRVVQQGKTTNPRALLYTAVEHRAINQARQLQTRRRLEVPAGLMPELAEIADEQLYDMRSPTYEGEQFTEDFDRAVRALEEDDRDPYILTAVRGLSSVEAAAVLDAPQRTVHRRAERARLTVKEEIR